MRPNMKCCFSEQVKVLDLFILGEERRLFSLICGTCVTNSSCHRCSVKAVSEPDEVTHILSLSLLSVFPSLSPFSLKREHANTQASFDTFTHIELVTL